MAAQKRGESDRPISFYDLGLIIRTGTSMMVAPQVEQVVDMGEAAATKPDEYENMVEMTERTATAIGIPADIPRSTAGATATFASRTNKPMKPNMLILYFVHVTPAEIPTSHVWYTTTADACC